jgi:hypothetical protein
MRAAINQYFAHRTRCSINTFDTPEIKERCLRALRDEARKSRLSLAVAPGTIILSKGDKQIEITSPVWMDEQKVS